MKNVTLFGLFLLLSTPIFSQDLSIWRIYGDPTDHNHQTTEVPCNAAYYLFGDENIPNQDTWWSIKNEGSSTRTIQLPLSFAPGGSPNLTIAQQPSQSVLAPGEEALFKIGYAFSAAEDVSFVTIKSDDPTTPFCGMHVYAGGSKPLCFIDLSGALTSKDEMQSKGGEDCIPQCVQCLCKNGQLYENCVDFGSLVTVTAQSEEFIGGTFWTTPNGIPQGGIGESCASLGLGNVGADCAAIELSDPCACENQLEISEGQTVFRDVLTISSNLNALRLSANNGVSGSFTDINGTDLGAGYPLSDMDPSTPGIQFVFYRAPETSVNITVNGEPFMSAEACPTADACAIPTMPQWMLFLLGLILSSIAVVFIRNRYKSRA